MKENTLDEYIYKLICKSKEAYLMSIEIMNKPTIDYRTEGFLFFICNAWELMFKARIIKVEGNIKAINYKDKKNRTYSFEKCINILHNREGDKIKQNLKFLVQLRNTATHLIVPEFDYDLNYVFQTCVINYYKYINKYFGDYKLLNKMPSFISIVSSTLENENSFLKVNTDSQEILNSFKAESSEGLIINYNLGITKKVNEADLLISITKDSNVEARILEKPIHPNKFYPLSRKEIIFQLVERLDIINKDRHFSTHTFDKIVRDKKIKSNSKYCMEVKNGNSTMFCYSVEIIDYLYDLMVEKDELSKLHDELLPKHDVSQKLGQLMQKVLCNFLQIYLG